MEQNNNQDSNNQPSKNNNKNLIIAGIAIIIVIAIAIAVPHFRHAAPSVAPMTDTATATDTTGPSTDGSTVASLAAWNELFQKYDGMLVVFGADCVATPLTQSQQKGNTILLMNNGNVPHTITIGGASYGIGAYHYKTFRLNDAGNVLISCDAHKNVASVTVQ